LKLIINFLNLSEAISGSPSDFTLEQRIFNTLCFFMLVFVLIAGVINTVLDIHPIVLYINIFAIAVSFFFEYLSRFRKVFSSEMVMVYLLVCIVCYIGVWFFNGGIDSPVGYIFLMSLAIFVSVSPLSSYKLVSSLFFIAIIGLFVVEYYHPEWNVPYKDRPTRFLDHATTIIYSGVFILFSVISYKINFERERKKVEEQKVALEKSNEALLAQNQKIETLVKELNHRVKNNLQVVTSLLNLQLSKVKDLAAKEAIQDSKNRLVAMVLLHQQLYKNTQSTHIPIDTYLSDLLENILSTFGKNDDEVKAELDIEKLLISVETAIPIGLIINELVSNCLKHAFKDREHGNLIRIKLVKFNDRLLFSVKDNGTLKQRPERFLGRDTFGLELVRSLCGQLSGKIEIQLEEGSEVIINIPLKTLL